MKFKIAFSISIVFMILLVSCAQQEHIIEQASENQVKNADILKNGDTSGIETQEVNYDTATGFLAMPKEQGIYPAMVMIHEWWGLNDNIRAMAKQLAAEGYVVLAVDLYNGEVAADSPQAGQLASKVRGNPDPALENLKAAVEFLRNREDVIPEKIASLGWCFGGGMSLQLALTGTPLAATIIYYGSLETNATRLSAIKQPVLGIFGGKDTGIPVATVLEFNETLGKIGVPRDVYIYPDVGHAFASPSGANYAPEETIDAWEKTLGFLAENLKR